MKSTFVIGDIHGGLKALLQILDRASVKAEDRLIFLGDYVDGWSESAQLIDYLIQLSLKQECIFLRGNHDEWCEEWLRSGNADSEWLIHGGTATVQSYEGFSINAKQKHLEFFEKMIPYFIDHHNRLYVHAGFTSMNGPAKEFHISNFSRDRSLWEMALIADKTIAKDSLTYPKRLKLFNEIFIGHTPTLNYEEQTPMHACNVWDIDTGAAFTGSLSIMDVDSKNYWQSEPVKNLYPGEKGRNKN
ncbi:MAG: serine/threonine protein phosphatase [Bacteroidetes bacterium]|nr:serine/threonine protein phosphatase [Bacteroidota bacterium]